MTLIPLEVFHLAAHPLSRNVLPQGCQTPDDMSQVAPPLLVIDNISMGGSSLMETQKISVACDHDSSSPVAKASCSSSDDPFNSTSGVVVTSMPR